MSVELAREDAGLRRYPLRTVRIQAAGGSYRIVAPRSAAELLRRSPQLLRRASGGDHPHWAEVWPASIALFRRLLRGPRLDGVRACDLGCGIGVAGLGAGLRGAGVTFADREPEALAFAACNARSLGVARVSTVQLDWETDPLPEHSTLLLLADLGYQYRAVRALLRHVDAVLDAGGRVLCGDPGRPTANDLFTALVARGASVETARAEDPAGGGRVELRIAELGGGGR